MHLPLVNSLVSIGCCDERVAPRPPISCTIRQWKQNKANSTGLSVACCKWPFASHQLFVPSDQERLTLTFLVQETKHCGPTWQKLTSAFPCTRRGHTRCQMPKQVLSADDHLDRWEEGHNWYRRLICQQWAWTPFKVQVNHNSWQEYTILIIGLAD